MDEYADYAQYYDTCHNTFTTDIPFYVEYASGCGSPILELACGTGRVVLPLAEAGHTVDGIDASEKMLDVAQKKVANSAVAERVTLTHANMTSFDLPEKSFAMIFVAFRSFMHLYTQEDQFTCLRRVHEHLRPGGTFIVDVYSPNLEILARSTESPFKRRHEHQLPNGNLLIRDDRFLRNEYARQINRGEMRFEEYDSAGKSIASKTIPISRRYTFRFELQLLLEKAGFEIESLFGDYEKKPYDGVGEIIFVGRRNGG